MRALPSPQNQDTASLLSLTDLFLGVPRGPREHQRAQHLLWISVKKSRESDNGEEKTQRATNLTRAARPTGEQPWLRFAAGGHSPEGTGTDHAAASTDHVRPAGLQKGAPEDDPARWPSQNRDSSCLRIVQCSQSHRHLTLKKHQKKRRKEYHPPGPPM